VKELDDIFTNLIPNVINVPYINMIYGEKIDIIKDYVYPDEATQIRPGTGKTGERMPGGAKYIVIHDTGMAPYIYDGAHLNEYIHKQASTIGGRCASWHFSCGADNIYQHVPTTDQAWHAGDGSCAYGTNHYNEMYKASCIGGGNKNGIGVETCINVGSDYIFTLKRAAKLVAQLLIDNNLLLSDIKRHIDFSGKECPDIILNIKGLWETFLKDVETEKKLLEIDPEFSVKWDVDSPYVSKSGKVSPVYIDTPISITAFVTVLGKNYTYQYNSIIKSQKESLVIERIKIDLYNKLPKIVNSSFDYDTFLANYTSKNEYNATIKSWKIKKDILELDLSLSDNGHLVSTITI